MSEEDNKARDIKDAQVALTKLKAMKVLLANEDLAVEITVAGVCCGVSTNSTLIKVIDAEIKEVQKFLDGKPNNYA